MPNRTPAVTVIIPTYNRLALLREAVSSVLTQTFRDFEVLVVDDGSTDGTAEYLAGIHDPRLRHIPVPHSGNAARARNTGAAHALGQVLAFLDSDDVWLARKLEIQIAATAGDRSKWSYTRYSHIDLHGERIPARAGSTRMPAGRIANDLLQTDAAVSIVTIALPKALFDRVGGFNEELIFRQDYEFLVRLACAADAVAIDEELVLVREHASRSTRALTTAQAHEMSARAYEALASTLDDPVLRAAARQRRMQHLAMQRGERRGRQMLRRMARPLLGRESPLWRWLPWPGLRYRCFGDPLDCVLHALLATRSRVHFIQIGSNDGVANDPLWTFRRYSNWSGVLVEPLPSTFERLRRNYAPWKQRFAFVCAAISAQSGRRALYHYDGSNELRPDHDHLASLDADHVARHAHRFGPTRADVTSTIVETLTYADLLARTGSRKPDVLHIDAEGSDETVLKQLDLAHDPPSVILYESATRVTGTASAAETRLHAAGYQTKRIGADTLAVSSAALAASARLRAAWRW